MSKLLVVFGATGQQGGSIIDHVLNDPELSKQFKIRGLTRDPSGSGGQALSKKGIEVAKADFNDPDSFKEAVKGAHTVFAVTTTIYDRATRHKEVEQGKAIANACVAARVEYLIWSTLQNVEQISDNKLQHVKHFSFKADVEDYIRSLPIKSSFFAPGSFMQNLYTNMKPTPLGDGTFAISNVIPESSELPLFDIDDTGKFVGAILAEPERFEGKILSAAERLYSYPEILSTLSKATGKTLVYRQLPVDVFKKFLSPDFDVEIVEMFQLVGDYGYYGPDTKEKVEWSAKQARGRLATLAEYLENHPLKLE